MELIGAILKKSRLNKKIDFKSVADELKISQELIEEIESDNFSIHTNKIYLTGYVRSYANYLDLDADEVIKHFKIQISYYYNDNKISKLSKPLDKSYLNLLISSKNVSFISIIFISFVFYFLFVKSNDLQRNYSITPDVPENWQSELEEIEMKLVLEHSEIKDLVEKNDEITLGNLFNKNINTDFPKNESSVIASLPSANEFNVAPDEITLKFIYPTWFQLRNRQNQVIISKLMNSNDEYSYFIKDNYNLTVGNAGNILVLINGVTRGKVGKKGAVIDSLIINSEFNN